MCANEIRGVTFVSRVAVPKRNEQPFRKRSTSDALGHWPRVALKAALMPIGIDRWNDAGGVEPGHLLGA